MEERIIEIMKEHMESEVDEIALDADFVVDLGMNSIDLLEAVMDLENEYDVSVSDQQLKEFHTIRDIIAFLEQCA